MKETTRFVGLCFLICAMLAALIICSGCGSTRPNITYNIHFETGAFRVSDTLTVEPGQGGDDSSKVDGSASGGTDLSPGNNVVIRGFADQGNIFNIGTSQPATTETTATTDAKATATVNSPGSTTGTGGETGATGGGSAPTGRLRAPPFDGLAMLDEDGDGLPDRFGYPDRFGFPGFWWSGWAP